MSRVLYVVLAILGGAVQPVQTAMNARVRSSLDSPVLSALISLLVGAVALGIVLATGALGGRGDLSRSADVPWWAWTAGVIGALSVTINVLVVPHVGVAVTIGGAVCGQLVLAVLIDHFGWLGSERIALNVPRIAGALLLIAGTWLLQRK